LEACRRGERDAFDVLVERHHRRVFRLAMRLLGDEEGALDAAQETFVKAWRALPRFEGGALFTTWLTRIAINQCRNELRRRGTRKHARPRSLEEHIPGTDVPRGDTLAAPTRSPWEELRGRELKAAFEEVLAALEPEDREVLLLKEVEGLSYEDMAEVLGIPTGTVRSRLHRARAEVRRRIAPVL
jgi:RNA polymerase sigma-70 factor (ECF subfamily)